MALFFDREWFDARLAAAGLSRETLRSALGISGEQLAEMWKDQRELSTKDVRILSALLAAAPEEIARRAGISTPAPRGATEIEEIIRMLTKLGERIDRIERAMSEIAAALKKPD